METNSHCSDNFSKTCMLRHLNVSPNGNGCSTNTELIATKWIHPFTHPFSTIYPCCTGSRRSEAAHIATSSNPSKEVLRCSQASVFWACPGSPPSRILKESWSDAQEKPQLSPFNTRKQLFLSKLLILSFKLARTCGFPARSTRSTLGSCHMGRMAELGEILLLTMRHPCLFGFTELLYH